MKSKVYKRYRLKCPDPPSGSRKGLPHKAAKNKDRTMQHPFSPPSFLYGLLSSDLLLFLVGEALIFTYCTWFYNLKCIKTFKKKKKGCDLPLGVRYLF